MGTDPNQRARELLDCYDRADASAADLLCDRPPADRVAFAIVEADLSATDLVLRQGGAR
ncbi:hypothetical protein [Nocardia sp. R7R-8]|uniref:hypothetical protein n=1 Tax=Nocardia sp. R7R-8 TaxID=3459304 RepID=UPI00403D7B6D